MVFSLRGLKGVKDAWLMAPIREPAWIGGMIPQ
jgi:hypothetical protein